MTAGRVERGKKESLWKELRGEKKHKYVTKDGNKLTTCVDVRLNISDLRWDAKGGSVLHREEEEEEGKCPYNNR